VILSTRIVIRAYRLAFGLLVLAAILIQMGSLGHSGLLDPLHYLTYFTNLSNMIAAAVFILGAMGWRFVRSSAFDVARGGAVVYMTITGVVFAVLLSGVNVDAQLRWVNDLVHQVFPIVVLADWLLDPPTTRLTVRQSALWLGFPSAWVAYELIRGVISEKYHYPFLNPVNGGYGSVALYMVVILVFTVVVCGVVLWLANARRPTEAARPSVRA
jgi:hypothetical protein